MYSSNTWLYMYIHRIHLRIAHTEMLMALTLGKGVAVGPRDQNDGDFHLLLSRHFCIENF